MSQWEAGFWDTLAQRANVHLFPQSMYCHVSLWGWSSLLESLARFSLTLVGIILGLMFQTFPPDLVKWDRKMANDGHLFSSFFCFAQPCMARIFILVFHFLVAFVYSEMTEMHSLANGISFQEKPRSVFLRDRLLCIRDLQHQRNAYLLYPPKSAMPA